MLFPAITTISSVRYASLPSRIVILALVQYGQVQQELNYYPIHELKVPYQCNLTYPQLLQIVWGSVGSRFFFWGGGGIHLSDKSF